MQEKVNDFLKKCKKIELCIDNIKYDAYEIPDNNIAPSHRYIYFKGIILPFHPKTNCVDLEAMLKNYSGTDHRSWTNRAVIKDFMESNKELFSDNFKWFDVELLLNIIPEIFGINISRLHQTNKLICARYYYEKKQKGFFYLFRDRVVGENAVKGGITENIQNRIKTYNTKRTTQFKINSFDFTYEVNNMKLVENIWKELANEYFGKPISGYETFRSDIMNHNDLVKILITELKDENHILAKLWRMNSKEFHIEYWMNKKEWDELYKNKGRNRTEAIRKIKESFDKLQDCEEIIDEDDEDC